MNLYAAINPPYFHPQQTLNITVGNSGTDESLNGLDLKQNTSTILIMMTACKRSNT